MTPESAAQAGPPGISPGVSLATSLENHVWVRGGWFSKACSHSGPQPLWHPLCHLREHVPQVGAHTALTPGWGGQAKCGGAYVWCGICLGTIKDRRQNGPGFNLALGNSLYTFANGFKEVKKNKP